ncbi:MAG: hypothetical protein L3J67_07325 [Hyphomicrobiaceae bacterium]|nr:hypothetical protein [Hyphomicrobiaceae bacterium]
MSGSLLSNAAILSGSKSLLGRETFFLTGLALATLLGFGFGLARTTLRFTGLGFGLGLSFALAIFFGFGLGFGLAFTIFFFGLGLGLAFTTFFGFGLGFGFAIFTGFRVGFFLTVFFFLSGTAAFFLGAVFWPALILVNCEGVMISTGTVVFLTGLEPSPLEK